MGDIIIHKERMFRKTDGVHFADISIEGSNGMDLVEHKGKAVSPPSVFGVSRWYMHRHQTDNNRVIQGSRLFELFCDHFKHPHWYVFLDENTGALEIPPFCYHRSISGKKGSILVNHAIRDARYDEKHEFKTTFCYFADLVAPRYFNITPFEVEYFQEHGVMPVWL